MKLVWSFMPPLIKAVVSVCAFLVGLGWGSYMAINALVKSEVAEAKEDMIKVRNLDMEHINRRFDDVISEIRKSK